MHRQIALDAVAHLALGCQGFGCEDALCHLLNYTWPNVFENNAHVIQRFVFSSDAMRVSLGPGRVLQYCLQVSEQTCFRNEASRAQGLFHPARKVRDPYWKVYNNLILGSADALVAAYPKVPSDGERDFVRQELEYVL